jgi:ABC-2 type transport system permease protein
VFKLLRIETRKQITSSGFWILIGLHFAVIALTSMNFNSFLENANLMVKDIPDIDLSLKPILQFPDVWQNLTYISGYFKIILAVVVVTSVCNEFTYSTARQNIIDGLSRREWLFSKIALAKILALGSTFLVLIIGLVLGYTQGVQVEITNVFSRLDFVLAYFIELLIYFIYALFLALILKRTGMTIIILLVYDFIFEPIISWSLPEKVRDFLPMNTIDNLNQFPFLKYLGNETQSIVSLEQVVWALVYGLLFAGFSYLVLKKRDL